MQKVRIVRVNARQPLNELRLEVDYELASLSLAIKNKNVEEIERCNIELVRLSDAIKEY